MGQLTYEFFRDPAAPLCSVGIERARKGSQGWHFVRCCHSTHSLLFRGPAGVTREGQQQFGTQTLRVHLLGLENSSVSVHSLHFMVCAPLIWVPRAQNACKQRNKQQDHNKPQHIHLPQTGQKITTKLGEKTQKGQMARFHAATCTP